jgi:hypothetical protein
MIVILLMAGFIAQPDDKELFMGLGLQTFVVKPNVVVLMDSSGSMNTAIYYPKYGLDSIDGTEDDGYDRTITYSGWISAAPTSLSTKTWIGRWDTGSAATYDSDNSSYMTGCYEKIDGFPNRYRAGGNAVNFNEGDEALLISRNNNHNGAIVTIDTITNDGGTYYFDVTIIRGGNDDGTLPTDIEYNNLRFTKSSNSNYEMRLVKLYGTVDNGFAVRYDYNYLLWLFAHSTDYHRECVTYFADRGLFDYTLGDSVPLVTDTTHDDWAKYWESNCVTPGHDRIKNRFTRIQVAREVICKVATDNNETVNLGLFKFDSDNGGYQLDSVSPANDLASALVAYKNMVADIRGNGWTPLAESLAEIWRYYKPGPDGEKDFWPVDYYSPVHDIEHWCQNNYVIIMTDGESTQDRMNDFDGGTIDDGRYNGSIFMEKPAKRTVDYTTFAEWDPDHGWGDKDDNEGTQGLGIPDSPSSTYCPNNTCWNSDGSDYLDDVAYFIRHQDLFPDEFFGTDPVTGWPGEQNIFTYAIGFTIDNDLLKETAANGEGAYYTANNYEELSNALQSVITGILLRNFAFSAITAPKKTATTADTDFTVSYVGYFLPSQGTSIWDGHLLAFELIDRWGYDINNSGDVSLDEFIFDDPDTAEMDCANAANADEKTCERLLELDSAHKWDAATKLPETRNLFTHSDTTNIPFNETKTATLIGPLEADDAEEAGTIIRALNGDNFGDVFHSDVGFIGPPPAGKKYIKNIDPLDPDGEKFVDFHADHENRRNQLFVGTNDGILHMMNADDDVHEDEREAGVEIWGFIPDEVLPSLKDIVVDYQHTYTVDGRLSAEDIFYTKSGQSAPSWSTVLTFGLRRGGNAYYTMDITEYSKTPIGPVTPTLLWKYKNTTYSGESWGKAAFGKILLKETNVSGDEVLVDKWVTVLTGGFAFNEENEDDLRGKAIFVVDASNGDLIWMIGYHPDGDANTDDNIALTDSPEFNFPIPSALTLIDKDNSGYVDTIYYGNIGGHLFKTDISGYEVQDWTTVCLYKTNIVNTGESTVDGVSGANITVVDKDFVLGQRVRGLTSNAQAYITEIDNKILTVKYENDIEFVEDEAIVCRSYDPIYLSPAVAFNTCFQLWVTFGTGDRDRPRSNMEGGHYIAIRDDNSATEITTTNLDNLSSLWNDNIIEKTELDDGHNGWYFAFPDDGEKMFDPEPIILPDENMVPHILFNTYQPPGDLSAVVGDNPCAVPTEGTMILYDIMLGGCSPGDDFIEAEKVTGRIAGGGIYQGEEYVLYTSESGKVADVPGEEGSNFNTRGSKLPYPGGVVFWKEKKR